MRKWMDLIVEKEMEIFWHGSPSGELRGGDYGIHLGTHEAARQALEARIGIPADGSDWDGTRAYGETLLAGRKTQERLHVEQGRNVLTGFNCSTPDEDFYAKDWPRKATYSDRTEVALTAHPSLKQYRLAGPMSNTPRNPMEDSRANATMRSMISRGIARKGYYYENCGEDAGSISIVVPNEHHIWPMGRGL